MMFLSDFSHIKHVWNKIRRKILDEHFENTLRIASTKPDIDKVVSKKQTFSVFSLKIFIFS